MPPSLHLAILFLFVALFANPTTGSGGFCDEPNASYFCNCDERQRETTVTCFISDVLDSRDEMWTSLGRVDNVVTLKLYSRLPVRLAYVPTESLRSMPALRLLVIQQGNLSVLPSYAVSGFKELRDLQLDGSDITALQPHAISDLPKLKTLTLSENLLQEVLADSLTGLLELEQLYLDKNNISRIEGCAFCDLQNLKELELYGNRITDLTEYMFRGLRYLRRLDLYNNQIRILNNKIFHAMPKLIEIDLKDNHIEFVAPRAFHGLASLQRLMLNKNRIKVLPNPVFQSLPNLRSVDMDFNELDSLQVQVLENMHHSKSEHFSFAFRENPLKCDCRLRWVKDYIHINKSYQFTKELQSLQCLEEDGNTTSVHLMGTECNKKKIAPTANPPIFVPYEIHGRTPSSKSSKVKDKSGAETEDEPIPSQKEMADGGTSHRKSPSSASCSLCGDFWFLVTLLTIGLMQKPAMLL